MPRTVARHRLGWSQRPADFSWKRVVLGLGGLTGLFLVLAILFPVSAHAAEPGDPSASVALPAVCVNEDGQVTVTLNAGTTATEPVNFVVLLDRVSVIGDPTIPVDPGQSQDVVLAALDDGSHTIEVTAGDSSVYPETQFSVACDVAPVEPYANAKAVIYSPSCSVVTTVNMSNKPIAGDVEHLLTVPFVISVMNDAGETVLTRTFKLPDPGDATPYVETWEHEFPRNTGVYTVQVTPGDDPTISETVDTGCMIVDDGGMGPKHPHGHHHGHKPHHHHAVVTTSTDQQVLPNTGLSVRQWQLIAGVSMVLVGLILVFWDRRPQLVKITE